LPKYAPKAEIEIDLTRPVEELQQIILLATYGPEQHEMLKQMDLWLGETLIKIEEAKNAEKINEQTNPAV
jgi:hypothetical protein